MRRRRPFALLPALGLCACVSLGRGEAPLNCATPSADTSGWARIRAGSDFSFLLPPGFHENKVVPIDSYVRGFEAEGSTLTLDYGHFSADLRGSSDAGDAHLECPEQIGGRSAVVVLSWPDRVAYDVGASWRDVTPGVHLWMGGSANTPAGQRKLLTVLRSVRFDVR
jgi:hypothetical protein